MTKSNILTFIFILTGALIIAPFNAKAQNDTRSPYSSKGFGEQYASDFALNRAYGGISNGLRSSNFVSVSNAAALTALRKNRVIYNFGFRGDYGQTFSGSSRFDYRNGNFSYLSLAFPVYTSKDRSKDTIKSKDNTKNIILKNPAYKTDWAMAFGISPYSSIGSFYFRRTDTTFANYVTTFGNYGGLTKAYISNSFRISRNLSAGVTSAFLFGQINSTKVQIYPDTARFYDYSDESIYHFKGFRHDFGVQYNAGFGRYKSVKESDELDYKYTVVAGATFTPGSSLNYTLTRYAHTIPIYVNTSGDTLLYQNNVRGTAKMASAFSVGATVTYKKNWLLGIDYKQDNLAKVKKTIFTDSFSNATQLTFSFGFRPDADIVENKKNDKGKKMSNFEYRFGYKLMNTGYNFKGTDGKIENIKAQGMSFGIGIPKLRRVYSYSQNNWVYLKSMINVTGEYISRGQNSNGLVGEKIYRLTIGFSLSDLWFDNRKIN
ncbi:MAG: hypothetical protein H7321_09905 [Bacteroidia bacterium]|nr:hypothetical protein [Bacteroidia bacterium]